MDQVLINNWNSRVGKNDLVIFLGDFMFKQKYKVAHYIDQLDGYVTFIKGNHDNKKSLNTRITSLILDIDGQLVFCNHFPESFSNRFNINLVAHSHDKWKIRKIYNTYLVNVGVDAWNYYPVDFNGILKLIESYKRMKLKEKRIVEGLETYKLQRNLFKDKIANPPKKLENL